MDRLDCSESVCEVCHGKTVAFLWARGSNADGRWVINEAINAKKNKGGESSGVCSCGGN